MAIKPQCCVIQDARYAIKGESYCTWLTWIHPAAALNGGNVDAKATICDTNDEFVLSVSTFLAAFTTGYMIALIVVAVLIFIGLMFNMGIFIHAFGKLLSSCADIFKSDKKSNDSGGKKGKGKKDLWENDIEVRKV